MNKIATESPENRRTLFRETGIRKGNLDPALVEKDFWVCWTLRQLFSMKELDGRILFKGGTTLSKVYGAIKRFSEDIDLAVNYEALGFTGERSPDLPRSGKKRKQLHEDMIEACRAYVAGDFVAALRQRFKEILGPETTWKLQVTEEDGVKNALVHFIYPQSLPPVAGLEYVRRQVLIEPGARAVFTPRSAHRIMPFAAEEFPRQFSEPDCQVVAIDAEQTFWDKATILHAEYHRPEEKALPLRYSRHYFDLAAMTKTPIKDKALASIGLLEKAASHKIEYFYNKWACYELAKPETLRLAPPDHRLKELSQDYEAMRPMIFETPPPFEAIVNDLASFQEEIRRR